MAMAHNTGEPCVVLCDRGACDGKAYIDAEGWAKVIARRGCDSDVPLREGRYNAVLHLVTSAKGAEKFYSLANNGTRSETAEEARSQDEKTQRAWMGHPRLYVFDNISVQNFEAKLRRVVDTVAKIVGLPLVARTPTKFLLAQDAMAGMGRAAPGLPGPPPASGGGTLLLPSPTGPGDAGGAGQAVKKAAAVGGAGWGDTSLDHDPWALALRRELRACGEGAGVGEGELQVFEVEKVYVLAGAEAAVGVGGGGASTAASPALGAAIPAVGSSPAQARSTSVGSLELQYSFIRSRRTAEYTVYGHTTVSQHSSGERVEVKRIITRREYEWTKSQHSDPARHVVVQRRYCFLWQGKTFSVYRYLNPVRDLAILHCQPEWKPREEGDDAGGSPVSGGSSGGGEGTKAAAPKVELPPFLRVAQTLSEDGQFSAYKLSLKPAHPNSPSRCSIAVPRPLVPGEGSVGSGSSGFGFAEPPPMDLK